MWLVSYLSFSPDLLLPQPLPQCLSLTGKTNHTTLSSNTLRSRGTRRALWEADRGEKGSQ